MADGKQCRDVCDLFDNELLNICAILPSKRSRVSEPWKNTVVAFVLHVLSIYSAPGKKIDKLKR